VDIDLQLVHDVRRASGLRAVADDERGLTDGDVALLELFKAASAFFSHDEVLRFSAVVGSAMRRIADAADEMFLRDVEAPLKGGGESSELEMAQAGLLAVELAQVSTGIFAPMFLGHFETSTQLTRLARRNSDDYETVPLAIGFVDLSGFTERSSTLSPRELRDLVVDFEMRASGIVGDHDGRVIKLIGDEVMFSAIDAEALCSIALALIEAAPSDIPPRGGLAYGEVVASGGDRDQPAVASALSRPPSHVFPARALVNIAQVFVSPPVADRGRGGSKKINPCHGWRVLAQVDVDDLDDRDFQTFAGAAGVVLLAGVDREAFFSAFKVAFSASRGDFSGAVDNVPDRGFASPGSEDEAGGEAGARHASTI
jgi:adenylate cyclase